MRSGVVLAYLLSILGALPSQRMQFLSGEKLQNVKEYRMKTASSLSGRLEVLLAFERGLHVLLSPHDHHRGHLLELDPLLRNPSPGSRAIS